jgi:elongation factor Ts
MAPVITADQVKTLREKTGAGMMECKAALSEAHGDLEEAVTILRKRGVAQAAKRSGRTTSEGLVATRLSADQATGVIAEINCESDFVARTEDFQKLVTDVIAALLAAAPGTDPASVIAPGSPIAQQVTATITKTGENITISRVGRLQADGGVLGTYIHLGGKIGVLLKLTGVPADKAQSEDVATLLKELAMHIAAAAPQYATRDGIPADVIEKEKQVYRAQMENSGKPAQVIEKIVDGKLGSFFGQFVLPEQPTIRDPKVTVAQMLATASKTIGGPLAVTEFLRFKVGEASQQ